MQKLGKYVKTDRMSELVSDNYRVLLVMSRFGIGLGFGDKTIDAVCRDNGVDTFTFLVVVNMLLTDETPQPVSDRVHVASLVQYLHNSHDYFLDFRLPEIRRKLVEVVGVQDELSRAIVAYFDGYIEGVQAHMAYEEEIVFPYVRSLLEGRRQEGYRIEVFRQHHDQVETLLTEFKQILIKFYPSDSTHAINGVLFDIFNCEYDLASHNAVEDRLFIPTVRLLEQNLEER
ncbi:MAG TPA: hemerythrin domain-containing protein [Candidatus Tidjanibacter faecipullorum]|uniref:Hemerythrin domain-containing protein n=1 Tax=Candidatus Tidjanibacter faecipullorum TaxID=2838766 RepID=A0A9D2DEQ0_9BACT|nr:hemerythrin domain-containing protein [Candidatus Tidjanibacter faecipullorum]